VDDIMNHIVARVLDQFDIDAGFAKRWDGKMRRAAPPSTGGEDAPVGSRD
jgi:4-hydroxy-3-polyprenylbenzoate decarboxylase